MRTPLSKCDESDADSHRDAADDAHRRDRGRSQHHRRSLAEIKRQLASGVPLIQGELFSDDDFDERVRRLVAELKAKGAPVRIQLGTRTITPEVLANVFQRAADELKRQGELMNEEATGGAMTRDPVGGHGSLERRRRRRRPSA